MVPPARDPARAPENDHRFTRALLESSPNIIYVYSIARQRHTYVSPQVARILGYTPGDLLGMGQDWLARLLHPDDEPVLRDKLARAAAAADGDVVVADYRLRHRDGRWRRVVCHNVVFSRLPDGRVDQLLGTVSDVTAQREVAQALRESEQRYRTVVENRTELICHYLPDTTLTFVNDAYCRYFGRTRRQLIGSRFLDLLPPGPRAGAIAHVQQILAEPGRTVRVEHEVIGRDGNVAWQEWTDHAIIDEAGEVRELQGIGRDVTSRHEAEDALRRALDQVGRLKEQLQVENAYLQEQLADAARAPGGDAVGELVVESEPMRLAVDQLRRAAPSEVTVLLVGETGTGKELFAGAIHRLSPRRDRPFVRVNCGALPPHLIESELFGHERGAFTGAVARRLGRFESADGGTLFLDEVAELPRELQPKLLRVLQEGEFERVGSSQTRKVNVRVIAATNRDLAACVADQSFRADLYYRLNVIQIAIPPLRDRPEDIPALAAAFLADVGRRLDRGFAPLSDQAIAMLQGHDWPGNVRELQNVIERAGLYANGRTPVILPAWVGRRPPAPAPVPTPAASDDATGPSNHRVPAAHPPTTTPARALTLEQMEREYIVDVLTRTRWRVEGPRGAAALLGLHPSTLRSRIKKLGIR